MKHNSFKELLIKTLDTLVVVVLAALVYRAATNFGALAAGFKSAAKIFAPFFYGFLLAYVLNIPCNGISRLLARTKIPFLQKHKKGISISIVYILLILLAYVALRMVIPAAYESILVFVKNFDRYYRTVEASLAEFLELFSLQLDLSMKNLLPLIKNLNLDGLLTSVQAIVGVSSGILQTFLALISSVYTLLEKDKFKAFLDRILRAFLSDTTYTRTIRYTGQLNRNFKQYIYAQTLDGCIMGILAGIELALLGSQFALVLGIMLALVNYIPYFGSIVGTIISVLVVMFSQGIPTGLLALVILLVTQQIDGNIIQPRLMSNSFSISPLLVIVSVTVGGAAAGVLGMLAAIPLIATLLSILEDIVTYFEQKKAAQAPKSD